MKLTIKVNGLDRLHSAMSRAGREARPAIARAVKKITATLERHGLDAVRSGPTRAFDTGNLFNNIGSVYSEMSGVVYSAAPYSLYVHEGTRFMTARPYFQAAADNAQQDIEQIIGQEVEQIFN